MATSWNDVVQQLFGALADLDDARGHAWMDGWMDGWAQREEQYLSPWRRLSPRSSVEKEVGLCTEAEVTKTPSKNFYEIKVEVIDKNTKQLIIKRTAFRLEKP